MPDEAPECLLNLPLHAIDLPAPVGAISFAEFLQQADDALPDPDLYVPRRTLGRYLAARMDALMRAFPQALTLQAGLVTDAWRDGQGWWLTLADKVLGPFDRLLLAQGQPLSRGDDQITRWQGFAADHALQVMPAYPGCALVAAAADWAGQTVAVRGLGLSAFDVVAMLTLGLGGRLGPDGYQRGGQEPRLIVPFSRDGLPPMPKPALSQEPRYALLAKEQSALQQALRAALAGSPAQSRVQIAAALAPPAARITGQDATGWLETEFDPDADHDAADPVPFLRHAIGMAEGTAPPATGYAVGQIWRALQPDLRALFHATDGHLETRAAVLAIDSGLKRITYGPPLASARLMLALVEAGLVQLGLADDPDIVLQQDGWVLDADVTAQVMIDAVLPAPQLATLADPLVRSLWRQGYLRENPATGGVIVGQGGAVGQGLYLLGRLGEGCSIATDSIHDCFGVATRAFAQGLADA